MSEKTKWNLQQWIDRRDIILFAGLILIGWGGWWIFPPMALMVPGAILTGIAIFGVRK